MCEVERYSNSYLKRTVSRQFKMKRLKTVLNQDGGYFWGGKWGNGMGRVHTVVYVYVVHAYVYTQRFIS